MLKDGSSWHALIHMNRTPPQRQQQRKQENHRASLSDNNVGAMMDDAADRQPAAAQRWSVDVQPPDHSDFYAVLPGAGDAATGGGHMCSMQYQVGDQPHQQAHHPLQHVCFGEIVYAMLPFASADVAAQPDRADPPIKQSARTIAAMESQLRGIYCPAELAELEITLLTQFLTQAAGARHCASTASNTSPSQHAGYHDAGNISHVDSVIADDPEPNRTIGDVGLEDRIIWHLVHNILCHRRANYAKRVGGLRLFVRAGLFKTYAAQGYHLQPLQPQVQSRRSLAACR
jgi:hypothetical protein